MRMRNLDLLVCSLNFIEDHLRNDLKTTDIANACCCSKSTLEKMFQYVYSTSVHHYVIYRRMMLAAKSLTEQPDISVLTVVVEFGYGSHEAFTRAFKEVWNCTPSAFRKQKYWELYPRFREPIQEGEYYIMERKSVDISQLYDLFQERKDCYFICCDIKNLTPINDVSRKAGDLAILESMQRMNAAAGTEDIVFRIGGDEFCMLTASTERTYADKIAADITKQNGEPFLYEGTEYPLTLYVTATKFEGKQLKYNDLFAKLHLTIKESKTTLSTTICKHTTH